MSHGIKSWTFKEVEKFLIQHDFIFNYVEGSHYFYVLPSDSTISVCVPFHGSKTISPRTMKGIISQSKIDKKVWFSKK